MDKWKILSREVMDINILISKTIERKIEMPQLNHYRKIEKYFRETTFDFTKKTKI